MPNNSSAQNPKEAAEKLATQAETGEGRSMARPGGSGISSGLQPGSSSPNNAPLGDDMGSLGAPGGNTGAAGSLSGNVTNDTMPSGGAVGGQVAPDTVKP